MVLVVLECMQFEVLDSCMILEAVDIEQVVDILDREDSLGTGILVVVTENTGSSMDFGVWDFANLE